MNKGYWDIRNTCQLVEFTRKLAGNSVLWVEHYIDGDNNYYALFTDTGTSQLPITTISTSLNEFQRPD